MRSMGIPSPAATDSMMRALAWWGMNRSTWSAVQPARSMALSAVAEAVDEGRVRVGDRILFVAFGAGFTSGAAAITWTADPAHGRRAAGAGGDLAPIHQPSDWDGGDPVPEPIASILAAKQQKLEVPA